MYYVYVHRYASGPKKGRIFYVGKGKGRKRYKQKQGRSIYWKRISEKYGYDYQIIKEFDSETCAFSLEKIMISMIGRDGLCNLTDGGEGTSGRVASEELKLRMSVINRRCRPTERAIASARLANSKPVGTVCGLRFSSITQAAKFANPNNYASAKTCISNCVKGKLKTAYGYQWGIIEGDKVVTKYVAPVLFKKIWCSNGMSFENAVDAAKWASDKGSNSAILNCCNGIVASAYGFSWWYHGDAPKAFIDPRMRRRKLIVRSDGIEYNGLGEAVFALDLDTPFDSAKTKISRACRSGHDAFGYKWRYKDETPRAPGEVH